MTQTQLKTKKSPITPSLQESIISRTNADQTVSIVNLDLDDVCYSLDGLAAEIWTLIDGKKSLQSIQEIIIDKHHPPIEQFESDFKKLFQKLKKENLIDSH